MLKARIFIMINSIQNFSFITVFAALALLLSSCGTWEDQRVGISDPFEGANRAVFSFNTAVDGAVIHPIAKGYNTVVPIPARTGLNNALRNLRSPVNFTNQVLQGDVEGAGTVFVRALINTILGLGGLVDLAGHEGLEYEGEDFGQTLAKWGLGHGPYLVVPILGPSSVRDYAGFAVDSFADPLRWYLPNVDKEDILYGVAGANYLNLRASLVDVLEELERSSIDYYAASRSTYYQRREALVNDLNSGAVTTIPDYDDY